MKLKQKLLLALVASILATPTAFAVYDNNADENTGTNDDAVDYQNVNVTVPEVALIDISATAGPTFTFTNPNNAGEQFTMLSANNASRLKYSSNVATGTNTARKVTLSIDGGSTLSALPTNLLLGIAVSGCPVAGGGTLSTTTSIEGSTITTADLITGIANHATGTAGCTVTYTPSLKANETMIGHTSDTEKTMKLVYTLSEAS